MRSPALSPALVALAAFAGCEGHATRAPATSSTGGGTTPMTLDAGGASRLILVHVPPGMAPAPALVLNLHGSGSTAAAQESFSGMDALADAQGFVVGYPQGAIALGSGFAWNVGGMPLLGGAPVPPGAPDDSAFLRQVIAALVASLGVDPARVYATGMSGGGRMASQLGCDLADVVAAIAPVAGLRFPAPCTGSRAVPVITFHGTADTVNPYDGGGEAYWGESVPAAELSWAAHDGCSAAPQTSAAAAGVTLTAYDGCRSGAVVDLYTIDGAGHEWPGAAGQTNAIDASAVMWAFFGAHRLR